MILETQALFVTPLAKAHLGEGALLDELRAAIWMLQEGDEAGAKWCAEQGYEGYTSYASLDDLPQRASCFQELLDIVTPLAEGFATDHLAWEMGAHHLCLEGFWVNILPEGGQHTGHIHPGSVISGTVYIDMPEGSGAIKFEDPRLAMMQAAPPVKMDAPEAQCRFVYRTPKAGTILLWESWLRHEVMAHRSEHPRLSISFNFGLGQNR
mgnify:CR=1 FL=1